MKTSSPIELRKLKSHEKRDRPLVFSKMKSYLLIQFSQTGLIFLKKCQPSIVLEIQRAVRAFIFSLKFESCNVLSKQVSFFCLIAFTDSFFELSVGNILFSRVH